MATKTKELSSVEQCKQYLISKDNFVLQGGAGSGKTESLKELLLFIKQTQPSAKVACITHTNVAVDEILSRVGDGFFISTIHSFANNLIKDYKKNIKTVIADIFTINEMIRLEKTDEQSEMDYKKSEHDRYKKTYEKYSSKLFDMKNETAPKAVGKREYDKNPELYNNELNDKICDLNIQIQDYINNCEYAKIEYNETMFNSYRDITFGHDGLLEIFHLLFDKYSIFRKMIIDNYDYIFIDEYQDSNENIIKDFISIAEDERLTIALFGDSMQSIYKDGIGNVRDFIDNGLLFEVEKPDNFRCSHEVLEFINPLRLDGIEQKVALKLKQNGEMETELDRKGVSSVIYSICESKPNAYSSLEDKLKYQKKVDELLQYAQSIMDNPKILMLTNKSISQKNGFQNLYKIFDDRYTDVSDRMENYLKLIQVLDVCELCYLYKNKNYNLLIKQIRKAGFVIRRVQDKVNLKNIMLRLIESSKLSITEAIKFAKKNKLIRETEMYRNTIKRNKEFLKNLETDKQYNLFKELYDGGKNTFARIRDFIDIKSEEEFDNLNYQYKKEKFIKQLFSNKIKFIETYNYYEYLNEETDYITMHKTKGSSISSVIVVMEEFFWNEYDFSLIYLPYETSKQKKRETSQKLIYVACSRARQSLSCIKVLQKDEVKQFKQVFPNAICFKDYTSDICK